MKKLERSLGLVSVVSISVSAMLGSGIFVLPFIAASKAGPAVWLAYVGAGLCVLPTALSKSELATAMPASGGTYIYLERTFGPLFGTIMGLALWLSLLLKAAFALVGFGAYFAVLLHAHYLQATALTLLVVVIGLNIVGIKAVGKVQVGLLGISLVGLLYLVVAGLPTFHTEYLVPHLPNGLGGVASAAAFVFVAFAGVTKVAAIAEEVKEPEKNLPRGMIISLLLVTVLYGVVVLSMSSHVPMEEILKPINQNEPKPIYVMAVHVGGPTLGILIAILAILTMTSMANSGLLAASRFPFALARDKLLPDLFTRTRSGSSNPIISVLATGLLMTFAIVFLNIEKIAKLASVAIILLYTLVNLTVIILRESNAQWYRPAYRTPLYPWTPLLGIGAGIALLYYTGIEGLITLGVLTASGLVIYFLYGRRQVNRRGLIQQMWRREDLLPPPGLPGETEHLEEVPGAEVVIPLFGKEVSPDTLVEIGTALLDQGEGIEVLHLQEVPEQTVLAEVVDDEETLDVALGRRVALTAERCGIEARFDAVVTRDVRQTLHGYAKRTSCKWVLMEWVPKERSGLFLVNPFSWLMTHLPCNLAIFKDSGAHHTREILVVAEPGPHDSLVVRTADALAQLYEAEVTFLRAVREGTPAWEVEVIVDYHDQLAQLCHVPTKSKVVFGKKPNDTILQASADYDLLVTGAPPERPTWSLFFGSRHDRIVEEAPCSVLRLKTPRKEAHIAVKSRLERTEKESDFLSFVDPKTLFAKWNVTTKKALFRRMAKALTKAHPSLEKASDLEAALWRREEMQNTAIGDGIAIPHATIPKGDRTIFGAVSLVQPIDFKEAGTEPVDLCFFTVGPPSDRQSHLKLVAALSGLLLKTDLARALREAGNSKELEAVFIRAVTKKTERELVD